MRKNCQNSHFRAANKTYEISQLASRKKRFNASIYSLYFDNMLFSERKNQNESKKPRQIARINKLTNLPFIYKNMLEAFNCVN